MKKQIYILCLFFFVVFWNCAGIKPKPIYTSKKDYEKERTTSKKTETASSESIRMNNSNIIREDFMREIDNLLGVPYRLGGTTPKGMDCSGFIYYVFENYFNKILPRRVSELYQAGVSVTRNNLKLGDLVFFNNINSPEISHVGVYLDADQFAHASESQGVIISSLNESYYDERYAGARRVIE